MEAVMQNLCVCVWRRGRALCKWKSICFPCWRWMLSAEQRLLALAFAVSNSQWWCTNCKHREWETCSNSLRTEMWAPLDPKAAQSSSSASLGDSLCFCSSARCWFCVEGTQVGTNQSCAGMLTSPSYSWSTSQDPWQPAPISSWRDTGPGPEP